MTKEDGKLGLHERKTKLANPPARIKGRKGAGAWV